MEIRDAIRIVVEGRSLSEAEAGAALATIMDGTATPAQIAAFLTALRMKGETVEEIVGFIKETRRRVRRIGVPGERLHQYLSTRPKDEEGHVVVGDARQEVLEVTALGLSPRVNVVRLIRAAIVKLWHVDDGPRPRQPLGPLD